MGRKANYEFLIEAGVPKYHAQVLNWMFGHKKGGVARTIVDDTGLSSSQVNVAVNELIKDGFLEMGVDTTDNGIGRKEHIYWLSKPKSDILNKIVGELQEKIDQMYELKFKLRSWVE